jgi:V/A-type H+/Na+-transporting ATPase subunit E
MSIQDIEKKIVEEAEAEAAGIKKERDQRIEMLDNVHSGDKKELVKKLLGKAKQKAEDKKRSILVPARLTAKKELLKAKQEIIASLYQEVKKEKKLSDIDLSKLREESEIKVAEILYG